MIDWILSSDMEDRENPTLCQENGAIHTLVWGSFTVDPIVAQKVNEHTLGMGRNKRVWRCFAGLLLNRF